jgi:hypothetical protein
MIGEKKKNRPASKRGKALAWRDIGLARLRMQEAVARLRAGNSIEAAAYRSRELADRRETRRSLPTHGSWELRSG